MLRFHVATYSYLASALAGSLAIYLWSRPKPRSLLLTAALSAAFALLYALMNSESVWVAIPAFLGIGSLASLSLAALWSAEATRHASLDTCLTASLFPVFLIVSGFSLAVTTEAHPKTYDLFLYAFDSQLGVQPSFLAGTLLQRFPVLRWLCYAGYEGLPLAMAISFAMERAGNRPRASSTMVAFTAAAAGGFLLYNIYPATGPVHVFAKLFPGSPPLSPPLPLRLVAVPHAARNAMPSVHIAMALLILWNSRLSPAWWRMIAALLLALTILATLGFGEHYLVDLLVATPFALAAQGLASRKLPWSSPLRAAATAGGFVTTLAWLLYLRSPDPPGAGSGLPWVVLLATAVGAISLETLLYRRAAGFLTPQTQTACRVPA
jgi:hypothetical protein